MKIATLQLSSQLGDVEGNVRRADALLNKLEKKLNDENMSLDLLVLPEMAFSGYNFSSLEAVKPHLEPTESGPTAQWARSTAKRLGCVVGAGYPEIAQPPQASEGKDDKDLEDSERRFNSLLIVNPTGDTLVNYQKHFLYYTDEPWAREGESHEKGVFSMPLVTSTGKTTGDEANKDDTITDYILTSAGICMDINPYKFTAPYSACEFATHAITSGVKLIIVSMAWLTKLSAEELAMLKGESDMETFQYWISRFSPFLADNENNYKNWDGEQILIVFANRAGEEEGAEGNETARYAGTSCVIGIRRTGKQESGDASGGNVLDIDSTFAEISIWGMLGAAEEEVCFVDTDSAPRMKAKV